MKRVLEMNTVELLKATGLTTAQVLKNLNADTGLSEKSKQKTATVRWFCTNVLLFNNFGRKILR